MSRVPASHLEKPGVRPAVPKKLVRLRRSRERTPAFWMRRRAIRLWICPGRPAIRQVRLSARLSPLWIRTAQPPPAGSVVALARTPAG